MRILIADDDPLVAEGLSRLLGYMGHDVSVSNEPGTALEQLKIQAPDVMLLDWLMPDGGGERVISALARADLAQRPKVILMTGSSDGTLPQAAVALPVLYKPFRLRDLMEKLKGLDDPVHPSSGNT